MTSHTDKDCTCDLPDTFCALSKAGSQCFPRRRIALTSFRVASRWHRFASHRSGAFSGIHSQFCEHQLHSIVTYCIFILNICEPALNSHLSLIKWKRLVWPQKSSFAIQRLYLVGRKLLGTQFQSYRLSNRPVLRGTVPLSGKLSPVPHSSSSGRTR